MSRVRVVTDSTADMDREKADHLGIEMIPHTVHWNGESYRDGVDLTVDEFYRKLRDEEGTPRTSQLSPGQLAEVYDRLLKEAEGIISLHLSSRLSGTLDAARLAASSVDPGRIAVVDSLSLSGCLGMLALRVAGAAASGASLCQCLALAEGLIPRLRLFIVLDTLEFLRRGGRIGRVQALAATILSIKPIIQVLGGVFVPVDRVRSRAAAVRRAAELVSDLGSLEEVSVLYGDDVAPARRLLALLRDACPGVEIGLGRTGAACGAHAGPGVYGAAVLLAN